VLNLAYNALCDGTCLQDLEQRRQDEVYLDHRRRFLPSLCRRGRTYSD
jgi:hypothetical protein